MYENPMVKTTFNSERLKSFPPRSETGKGAFAPVIQLVLEVLNKAIMREKVLEVERKKYNCLCLQMYGIICRNP